jgi:beta-alanine degradation protein BauB
MKRILSHCLVGVVVLLCTVAVMRSQQTVSLTQRSPQFENEDVRVWKSVVYPNAWLDMHRHDHPRVIIALSGGTMNIVEKTGATESHVWETGKAYWLPANPPNTMHADVNAGKNPIEVMVVELEKEH